MLTQFTTLWMAAASKVRAPCVFDMVPCAPVFSLLHTCQTCATKSNPHFHALLQCYLFSASLPGNATATHHAMFHASSGLHLLLSEVFEGMCASRDGACGIAARGLLHTSRLSSRSTLKAYSFAVAAFRYLVINRCTNSLVINSSDAGQQRVCVQRRPCVWPQTSPPRPQNGACP